MDGRDCVHDTITMSLSCTGPIPRVDAPPSWPSQSQRPWRSPSVTTGEPVHLYLSLLKTVLTNGVHEDLAEPVANERGQRDNVGCDPEDSRCTLAWDGWARLTALQPIAEGLLDRRVPGDWAEVGVFRGGISLFLQGILTARGEARSRRLWLVDSFQGMGSAAHVACKEKGRGGRGNPCRADEYWVRRFPLFKRNSAEAVQQRFLRHGLLGPGVRLLPGFVNDTLAPPCNPIRALSLLRIDVDVFAATLDALAHLYPRLTPGGVVLFDDWKLPLARRAAEEYRRSNGITAEIRFLPGTVDAQAYWVKP